MVDNQAGRSRYIAQLEALIVMNAAMAVTDTEESLLAVASSQIARVIEVDRASIARPLTADSVEIVGLHGDKGAAPSGQPLALEGTSLGEALNSGVTIHERDIRQSRHSDLVALERHGMRSAVVVPLIAGEQEFGTLNAARVDVDAFSASDLRILQSAGEFLAAALKSVTALSAAQTMRAESVVAQRITARRVAEMETLNRILRNLTQLDLAPALKHTATDLALLRGVDQAHVVLVDEDGVARVKAAGARSGSPRLLSGTGADVLAPAHEALDTGELTVHRKPFRDADRLRQLKEQGVSAMVAVPVELHGAAVGYVCLESTGLHRHITDEHVTLAQAVSSQISSSLGAARLLTRLQTAVDRAEASSRAKSEFLANMSHELRTPMNGVISTTELLMASGLTGEQHDLAATIHDSGDALLAVISDILDFSRIEAGKLDVERSAFEVRPCLESALDITASAAAERGLAVEFDCDDAVPHQLLGDGTRLRQILINLLGNATKFTESGEISLRARFSNEGSGDGLLRVSVSDTGVGISADDLGCIFESFTQVDNSATRRVGGSGLGLSICRQLAELMGGSIEVQSEVGVGSTFSLALPMGIADAAPAVEPEPPTAAPVLDSGFAERHPMRLLLVEDNAVNQKVALAILGRLGLTADVAHNGLEGVEAVRSNEYDIVLMDIQMPEMDGIEATRAIRSELDQSRQPRIIAVTANALEGDRDTYLAAGMDDYVSKPIRIDRLVESLLANAPTTPVG